MLTSRCVMLTGGGCVTGANENCPLHINFVPFIDGYFVVGEVESEFYIPNCAFKAIDKYKTQISGKIHVVFSITL